MLGRSKFALRQGFCQGQKHLYGAGAAPIWDGGVPGSAQIRATPVLRAASATALATAGHTRGSKAAGMM